MAGVDTFGRAGLTFELDDTGPGDGPVVVLLHGFPQTRACWAALTPALTAAGYRALAPDQRGYSPGARPAGREAYRVRELVGDVLALADAAGRDRVHLVGHDWGAAVAWATALAVPDRVATLTALSVPHPAAYVAAGLPQLLRGSYMAFFQLPRLPEMALDPMLRALVAGGLPAADAARYRRRLAEPGAATAALNWYRALPLSARGGHGGAVRVPTLYVWGARDAYLSRRGAELTERYVTAPYRFEVLPHHGHWLPERAADVLAPLLLEHLGRVSA